MEVNSDNYFNWEDKLLLIGEDEMVNFRLLEVILGKTKAKIIHGKTGKEVLELFKNTPGISLVLMDIKMPEMDGLQTTIEIRKINNSVPILAQTAYAIEDEKQKCIDAGCNGYITKPINRKLLLQLIQGFIQA